MSEENILGQARMNLQAVRQWALSLQHRPLLLCCIAVVGGMAFAAHAQPGPQMFAFLTLGAGAIVGLAAFIAPRMALTPLVVGAFALGGLVYAHRAEVPPTDLSHLAGTGDLTLEGTVIRPPNERGWRRRVRVEITGGVADQVTGRVEVQIPRKPELVPGDRVRLSGVRVDLPEPPEAPAEFDYRGWLARQGVHSVATARKVEVIGADRSLASSLAQIGASLRGKVVESIDGAMPGADGPFYSRLLVGMVYGLEVAPLPEEVVEQFRRAGTVHLLVVSGAQVSMLAITIVGLTGGAVRGMRWWQGLLAGGSVLVLVLIVGMEASVARAVAMFALVLLAALTSRDYDVYTAVAMAAAVILLVDPPALLSLSFQLTFAATVGVIVFLPDDAIRRLDGSVAANPLPQVRAVIWGTLGAWVMTTPLLAHSVSEFALSGNLANLANVPLSGVVLGLGFVALPVAFVPQAAPLLGALCLIARGVLGVVMRVNELAAGLPMPFVEGVQFSVGTVVAWYAAVALVIAVGLRDRTHRALDRVLLRPHPSTPAVAGFALISTLVCAMSLAGSQPRALEMTLLPVGAGQCAIIRAPARHAPGRTLMVDCGGGANLAGSGRELADGVIVPWLVRRNIDRLDAIAITHWDSDHCNALAHVLSLIPAQLLLFPPELPDARPPADLGATISAEPRRIAAGGRIEMADDITAELLAPRLPLIRSGDAANANSMVMMLTHGSVRILLTGDINGTAATRLVRDARNVGRSLRADVLVLPHHGRRLDEAEVLLDAVRPRWALASCDDDADIYLSEEQMALLDERGIVLLRTDEHGAITVFSDGRCVSVSASRGAHSMGSWVAAARR